MTAKMFTSNSFKLKRENDFKWNRRSKTGIKLLEVHKLYAFFEKKHKLCQTPHLMQKEHPKFQKTLMKGSKINETNEKLHVALNRKDEVYSTSTTTITTTIVFPSCK